MAISAYNSSYLSTLLLKSLYGGSSQYGTGSIYGNKSGSLYGSADSLFGANSDDPMGGSLSSLLQGYGQQQQKTLESSYSYFMQNYVVNVKSGASGLKAAMNDLTSQSPVASLYNKTVLSSSNPEAVEVSASSGAKLNGSMSIFVEQIASGQKNEGTALAAGDSSGVSGYQQFQIKIGNKWQQVSFVATGAESNSALQQKMADAINAKNIGITASVQVKNGESKLELQAQDVGEEKGAFLIRDVAGTSVAATGADNVWDEAANAEYRIDGGELRTSTSNTVDLGSGITATLKKATASSATITRKTDTSGASGSINAMVDSYNKLLSAIDDTTGASSSVGGAKLRRELTSIASTYASSLSGIGVNVGSGGYLSVDSDKMTKAIDDGSAQRFFSTQGNGNYGFSNRLSRLASEINRSPMRYMNDVFPNIHYTMNSGTLLDMFL